jgi:hypothetical protein
MLFPGEGRSRDKRERQAKRDDEPKTPHDETSGRESAKQPEDRQETGPVSRIAENG